MVLFSLILLTGFISSARASSLTDQDMAAIKAAGQSWLEAFKARDWDKMSEFYTEDAISYPANEFAPIQVGRAAIKKDYAALPPLADQMIEQFEIAGQDDYAATRGFIGFSIPREGGDPFQVTAEYVETWRKQPDGGWKISNDWNNYNQLPLVSLEEMDLRAKISTKNDALAQAALRELSTAAEHYATNNGKYPRDAPSLMTNDTISYLVLEHCDKIIKGFSYECRISPEGYIFKATPVNPGVSGTETYTIVTGGILSP